MRANKIIPLLITISFFAFSRLTAQCFPVNDNIDIYDLDSQPNNVLTLTGSTDGAENTFAIPGGTLDGLQFPAPDIIYEMVVEPGDTFNIFIDLCPGTNFDASIGIIHREDITDCANATDEDIVGYPDDGFFTEWRDSNGLCPDSDYGEIAPGNDGFVPLARDVYLEPGTYYIVVDGDNDGAVGDFTMVIGEMLEFDDYSLHEQNQYVDITFTSPVYGVSNDATWDLGWPMDSGNPASAADYFEFTQENGQPFPTGTVTQVNGQPLENNPYPGYTELRFPLINPPADGSTIFLAPKEHDFNGVFAPHPVNLSGIPFNDGFEMEIELNELSAPEIEGLSSLSEDNSSVRVTFSEGVYSSNNGTGGVASVHFTIESVGADLSPSIGSITDTSGTLIPTGGEEILKFNLSMAYSSGSESIRIRAQENAVFSPSGIAMGPQWSTLLDLNDRLPPEVSYSFSPDSTDAGVNPGAEIKIVFDDSVYFKGDVDNVDIESESIGDVISLNYEIDGIVDAAISFDATINTDKDTITIIPDDSLAQVKRVRVTVLGDTLVDSNKNPMTEKLFRFTVADIVIPYIENDYSLAANNEYVLINFNENLWSEMGQSGDIVPSDFAIELNSDHENSNATLATIEQVTDGEGNTAVLQNIETVRLYLGFDASPSGVESITITPASGEIFDQGNNSLPSTVSMSFDLSDQLSPSINIKSISSSDDIGFIHPDTSFVVTSTEPLERSDGTAITNENIKDYITLEYWTDSESIDYTAIVNENKTAIEIKPDTSMTEWDEVSLKIVSQNESVSIADEAGNEIETTTSIIRVDDVTAPRIDNATIDETNTYITLTTSESVYNGYDEETGGVGGLSESHFELSIVPNELNNVQNVAIENVKDSNGQPLQGGETTIRIEIILSRADASGSEVITVSPSERPIYDRGGNEVSVFLNQKTITLNDLLSPSVSYAPPENTLIFPNTDFVISFSETIKKYDSENGVIDDLDTSDIGSMITLRYINGGIINYETSFNADTSIFTLNPSQILTESASVELSFGEVFSDEFANSVSPGLAQYTVNDVNPPSFGDNSLGSGNRYVQINMSEGVYTDSSGTGALTSDDFNLVVDYGNQNGAELISIDYLSDISGGELSGGEDAILVNLSIIGSTNGTEKVRVHAVSGEIFDGSGNSMSPNESTTEYTLSAAPVFSLNSSVDSENRHVTLIFENGPVFTNEGNSLSIITQDFIVQLTNSDGVISEIVPAYLLIVDENDIPILPVPTGADIVRLGIYLDFIPDGSESIIISPESSNAIYNDEGVNMDGSEFIGPFTLNDQLDPFYNVNITDGAVNIAYSDTIIVSFNEPVRLLGGQPLTDDSAKENFIIEDIARSDTTMIITPDTTITIPPDSSIRIETYFTVVNGPYLDSIWVIMTQPFGSEHVISLTIENDFEDFSGNQVLEESTISFTARDNVSPGFVSGSAVIDTAEVNDVKNNPSEGSRMVCFVDAIINDNVFTDSVASLPIQANDFLVGIIQNDGAVSSAYIENIVLPDMIQSSQQAVRFQIRLNEVPSGNEKLFLRSADNNSIFDNGFNPMSTDSTSDTLSLYDLRFPTIDTTSIEHNGYVDLYSDSTILIYFSEPIKPDAFEYSFLSKLDSISFVHDTSLTPDSLTIFLNTPMMSYDTLDLSIIHLEDTSGNKRESLIERRFFTKAAADFSIPPDDRIGVDDLAIFVTGWFSGDSTKELGPYTGTAPNLKISPDNVFGIDDGMAFTQMWLWSLQTFGLSETMQQLVNMPSSISFNGNAISVSPPENAISGQVVINYDIEYYDINPGDNVKFKNNGIILSNNNDQTGLSVIEYALHKNNRSAVSFDVNNKDQASSEIKVSYSFFDEDFRLISKGDSILHSIALPTEFTLMQNYPNPFNPSTTIRFTIPSNSFVRLIVYDITGKVVNEIVNGYLEPGVHNIEWSGTDAGGTDVSSGVYFYRIEASNYSKTYKMVFVK